MQFTYEPSDVDISLCAIQPDDRHATITSSQLRSDASLQCLPVVLIHLIITYLASGTHHHHYHHHHSLCVMIQVIPVNGSMNVV